jgi:hypothetical protein
LLNALKQEIDELARFQNGKVGESRIRTSARTRRVLDVEVPPDTLAPERPGRPVGDPALREQFRMEAAQATDYARSRGVDLVFSEASR